MSKPIRIGTRDSQLALWQAKTVQELLERQGLETVLVPVKSDGDLNLQQPLYELGITGIFTKTLDIALINGSIDLAVHSMKDVPTLLPKGMVQAAVLPRASVSDVLIPGPNSSSKTVATGSLRRRAQWLNKYPDHKLVGLRGNVNTRLRKLAESDWQGAIFAKAGLERIDLLPDNHITLDWMIPAPAQGAMSIAAMQSNHAVLEACALLDDHDTRVATFVEREFLRVLEGGCTAPIGALATILGDQIRLQGVLLSLDGQERIAIDRSTAVTNYSNFGSTCAKELLGAGGSELMARIQKEMNK